VRETNVLKWLLALVVALLPCGAGAMGLGKLNVLSALGQPLVAEIDLTASREELGSLSARLANSDAYRDVNLQYNSALTGARVSVERRSDGRRFVRIATSRPVNEPFIDLLVEVSWAAGRLTREYTALLDPPGVEPAMPPAPVISAVPESRPAPPAQAIEPAPAPTPARPILTAPMAGANEYGPIQRGETLGKIAESVLPEGVTLEQMLVALYRSNTEAFIRKNLNLVRAGKILRVPDREEVLAISRGEAVKEYRAHVTDWNAYRQKLAEAPGTVQAEGRTAVSGKITTTIEEKAGDGAAKDVVRLSKGEPPGAAGRVKPQRPAERIRMLEEEAVAREKALKEANERVTQLEKTLEDMKKLVELKSPGMAAAQQAAAPKPESKGADKPAPTTPETVAAAKPEAQKSEASKPEQVAAPAPKPAPASKPAPKAKPKPKPKPAPKEPELMDQVLDALTDPLYLGIGGGVLALGGVAFWMARRRRARAEADGEFPEEPSMSAGAAADAEAASGGSAGAGEAAASEDVDPLAEAEVYIAYGRDGQAEEILKEALGRNPKREDVQLKLLEIYSARKDKNAFAKVAGDVHKLTGGAGDNWMKAAAMGYALDPANALYEAGKDAAGDVAEPASSTDIDLDLGLGDSGTATDITLEAGAADAAAGTDTSILDLGAAETTGEPPAAVPDIALDVPAAEAPKTAAPAPAEESNMIDFQIELPKVEEDAPTKAAPPAPASESGDGGLDFKLDGLDLGGGEPKAEAAAGGEKDGHWYDVQTKFDLAKAYQEMGDKDGAKEILQEVIKEGDTEQQTQAKALLDSLG